MLIFSGNLGISTLQIEKFFIIIVNREILRVSKMTIHVMLLTIMIAPATNDDVGCRCCLLWLCGLEYVTQERLDAVEGCEQKGIGCRVRKT